MKFRSLMLMTLGMISSVAMAGAYVGTDFSDKAKQDSDQYNYVYGVTVGTNSLLNKRVTIEGRMENEVVHDPSGHQGLMQGRAAVNLFTVAGLTPYVAGAVGDKSKTTVSFPYYVVEGGVKVSLSKNVDFKLASRLRSPFDESTMDNGYKYRTVENSVTGVLKLNAHNALTAKLAEEHGDSDYNTWGVGYVYSF